MKKFVSLLITAVMLLSLMPFSVFSVAAVESDEQGVQYTLSDDGTYYIVSGYTGTETELVIPEKFGDLPVTEIGDNAFIEKSYITSVELPAFLEKIGEYAFFNCAKLTVIEIPDSVSEIGSNAFARCSELSSANIPSALTIIPSYMFSATKLASIDIPNGVYGIGDGAFSYTLIEEIQLSENVEKVGLYAFSNCKMLKSIDIPDSVVSISDFAFENCTALDEITIGESVELIGMSAFQNCTSLTSLHIPASVTSISERTVLHGCSNITELTVSPENAVYVGNGNCIIEKETKTLIYGCVASVIPDDGSVTTIGSDAFSGYDTLTSIIIPDTITSLSTFCNYCPNLTDIYCEADEKPNGWPDYWLDYSQANPTIHWGYIDNTIDTTAVIGDVNADGKIDSADYLLVKRACFGTYELSEAEAARANIDGSDKIDSTDYALVKRLAFGTYSTFEPPVLTNNIALNKTYTGAEPATAVSSPYIAKLTDGEASDEGTYDYNWFGFWYNPGYPAPSNAPGGVATITIDLEQQYDDIQSVRLHIWQCNEGGIGSPESVIAYISDDGNVFEEIGELILPKTNDPDWAFLYTSAVSGRYVRLVINTSETDTWTFINEIEVLVP